LKSSVDEVEKEKKRLENILKDSDVELKEIKDRRIFFETALKKLGIDLK
jgi:septal ring factor EnvC (AmiA/AmiB activator)